MGRRLTVGVLPGGVGLLSIDQNTIRTVETNANLTLTADGSGIVTTDKSMTFTAGNLTMNAQGDIRFADADSSAYVAVQAPATVSATYTITLPSEVASEAGLVLQSDASGNTSWTRVSYVYSIQNTSFSASAWRAYFVDTSAGGVTATLPSSPTLGDTVRFFDLAKTFDTNNLTIARNGQPIQGDAANMTVGTEGASFELVYSNATYGWRIFTV